MTTPLIATKLHAPAPRPELVGRPRLIERVERGARSKLTLVSAPPGFGKTTLLAAHIAGRAGHATAWLSLDPQDNEPVTFWRHLVAALQSAVPGCGAGVEAALEAGEAADQPLLARLINELSAASCGIDLVLDDYHAIERQQIHDGVAFLIERMPPGLRLLIATRSDPPLPLARLRARGELVEIRAADLRFTPTEAEAYLNDAFGLALPQADVATLAQRTEGWIAALQLAALSLEGRDDAGDFVSGFAGNDRYIVDYLVEEVLQRQPEPVRRFLMRTCLLERLSGPLCDAVTGEPGGGAMLETLVRTNLFVVPLDARREWYRYHHLFADVLQAHFAAELGDERPNLHARASDWFAAHDAPDEAIAHALAARDVERAAALVERAIPGMSARRQHATLRAWLEALPDAVVRARPVLGVGMIGVRMGTGALEGMEARLLDAERAIEAAAAGAPTAVVVDRGQLPALPGAVELYRAALAQVHGDLAATVAHARRSIVLAPEDAHLVRAGAQGFLGIAHWTLGDLEAAAHSWNGCRDGLLTAGYLTDIFGASIALADINVALGRLRAAARIHEYALAVVAAKGSPTLRGTADAHAGLSELHRLSGDLDLAGQHLMRSQELGEEAGLPQFPYRWRVAMACLREAAGDPEAALDLLDEAERVYLADFFPPFRPIAAMKARILIRQGRLAEAERWQAAAGVTAEDEMSYLREFEHITLARLLLARDETTEALALLGRLLAAAEGGGRFGTVIEIEVLRALALSRRKDASATAALDRALALAEPEGFASVFIDEGEPMAALLKLAAKRGSTHARTLLALVGDGTATRPASGPVEPLSERELDVLRLLRSDLYGPEIARQLGISLNTMRTHTRNIYDKLGVGNRRAAVRSAENLALFERRR